MFSALPLRTAKELLVLASTHVSKRVVIWRKARRTWVVLLHLLDSGEHFGLSAANDPDTLRLFGTMRDSIEVARHFSGSDNVYFER
jgi:hypothetical protein